MKVLKPVIENPVYSELLFLINTRKLYASEIAKEVKKSQATTQRQLIHLIEEGYLKVENHPKKSKNIKLFSLNWERINKEFIRYMLSLSRNPQFKISDKYSSNKYLSLYFKKITSYYKELKIKTLKELFDLISRGLLDSFLVKGISKNSEFEEFVKFFELINSSNWEDLRFLNKSEHIFNEIFNEVNIKKK